MNKVFGYGSLMNVESLRQDVSDPSDIETGLIKGYRRVFNKWDPVGFRKGKKFAGEGFCAVNVVEGGAKDVVNGVVFSVDEKGFKNLVAREQGYKKVQINVFKHNGVLLCTAVVFLATDAHAEYDFSGDAQEHYLKACLDGARSWGDDFYNQFLKTTFVGNKHLRTIKEIAHLL